MSEKKRNKTKIVIIALAVLLALSLIALAGTVIYNKLAVNTGATVTVPDNLITPDEEKNDNTESSEASSTDKTEGSSATNPTENTSATVNGSDEKYATAISLYNKQPQDNTAFSVGNMFPGDSEVKYYRVQVSYHDKVTVHFGVDVRNGYEKLAEVMNVKVKLLSTGETLYEGLMKYMPQSVTHKLTSPDSTTDELYYEITAFLDTSVGNEYQNKDLIADFNWWVEETGNLDKAPQTGDTSNIVLWMVIAVTSATLCIILLIFRRKEEEQNG